MISRCGAGLIAAAIVLLTALGLRSAATAPTSPASSPGLPVLGASSCSARGCHGAIDKAGSLHAEYTTWLLHDPHAKAYDVLTDERSRRMLKNLGAPGKLDAIHPEKDPQCLQCHGPAALSSSFRPLDQGFSCESCHGPAQKWLEPHVSSSWKTKSVAEKQALGMEPLESLSVRAKVCTACHVGSSAGDVNHDLIAGGHPRLNFEFESYLANLPRHWQERKPTDEAPAWMIGQVVTTEAALQLLAFRADEKNKKPWPEFAEYDCFACHHDLQADSGRRKRGSKIPGLLPWNDWYTAVPTLLASQSSPLASEDVRADLDGLRQAMNKPLPPRAAVVAKANASMPPLRRWLEPAALDKAKRLSVAELLPPLIRDDGRWFVAQEKELAIGSWDTAAQLSLALTAQYERELRMGRKADPAAAKSLAALYRQLRFSEKAGLVDSPEAFDNREFVKSLREACKGVAARK